MALKNILNTTDYKTLYKNMVNDNLELKRINDELKNEIAKSQKDFLERNELLDEIARLKEDYLRSNELLDMKSRNFKYLEKNIKDLESYSTKLEFKIDDLNRELREYNPNLKPMKRKITREKVIEVRSMIEKGSSYRVTSKETGISIKTISRIANGYYNDL